MLWGSKRQIAGSARRREAPTAMTNPLTKAEIVEIGTAIAVALATALTTAAPVQEAAPTTKVAKAPAKAPKQAKAPKRTKAENRTIGNRMNGLISNATKAVRQDGATYEEMIAILAIATAAVPAGWASTHLQIARKAEQLAGEIVARDEVAA